MRSVVAAPENSRYNELQGPAEKVLYVEGMPKAIAKENGTSELVRYIKGTLYRELTVTVNRAERRAFDRFSLLVA